VTGHGAGSDSDQAFLPFYAAYHSESREHHAYFTVQREPRLLSESQKRTGARSSYVGSEVFLSLVDPSEAPFDSDLRQLSILTTCTNRDLPLYMPLGLGKADFTLETAAPLDAIRCIKGPSRPFSPLSGGAMAWQFISHLSLNYLSLVDANEHEGAAALREMLGLYIASTDAGARKQVEGVRSIAHKPLLRRVTQGAATSWVRGLEVAITLDESAFQVTGAYLLASVLERFFARYVSINSFTETVLRTVDRGEVARWPAHIGGRSLL
jgi:type VI secretion system protein ImpG